ncbi:MAG: hypothetical protein KF878_21005 [Planctomycetes bacterium]|nr:hypothetical protein [Planctomycetota bacterium]
MTEEGALEDLPRLALRVLDAYADAGLKAALGGGLAFNLWVVPRVTKDIDVNVFAPEEEHGRVLAVLERLGCAASREGGPWDDARRAEFLRRARDGEVAVAWHGDVRLDVFVPSIPFYDEAERTLREVTFPDGRARLVLSPEALAVFKLLFFRDKDLGDLRRLVAVQAEALDRAWVRDQVVGMVGEDDERVAAWDEIVRRHGPPAA